MGDVGGGAEEPVGPVVVAQAGEQEHVRPAVLVRHVPPAGGAVLAGGRLALPVDQFPADGVVAVAGGGGEMVGGLVERDEEQVRVPVRGPFDALPPRRGLRRAVLGRWCKAARISSRLYRAWTRSGTSGRSASGSWTWSTRSARVGSSSRSSARTCGCCQSIAAASARSRDPMAWPATVRTSIRSSAVSRGDPSAGGEAEPSQRGRCRSALRHRRAAAARCRDAGSPRAAPLGATGSPAAWTRSDQHRSFA